MKKKKKEGKKKRGEEKALYLAKGEKTLEGRKREESSSLSTRGRGGIERVGPVFGGKEKGKVLFKRGQGEGRHKTPLSFRGRGRLFAEEVEKGGPPEKALEINRGGERTSFSSQKKRRPPRRRKRRRRGPPLPTGKKEKAVLFFSSFWPGGKMISYFGKKGKRKGLPLADGKKKSRKSPIFTPEEKGRREK